MTKNEHCQEYTIPVLQPGSDHVQNLDINCINKIIRQELEESEHARQMNLQPNHRTQRVFVQTLQSSHWNPAIAKCRIILKFESKYFKSSKCKCFPIHAHAINNKPK